MSFIPRRVSLLFPIINHRSTTSCPDSKLSCVGFAAADCRELQTAYLQRASAAKRRQCPKYVVEPVCGLLFLVLLLVSVSRREQLNHIMQRTEGKLSVKDNEKCALWPLQVHFILYSLSLMLFAFLLMMLNSSALFFSVQVGLSTSVCSVEGRGMRRWVCVVKHISQPQYHNYSAQDSVR